jgi:hypothetical protein
MVRGLRLRIGGAGRPVLLLHGRPQTHAMWHAVADSLAAAAEPRAPPFRRGKSGGDGRRLAGMRVAAGFIGLLVAAFLGLIGLFLILYRGDAGAEQDITVSFWDTPSIDADLIGVPLVVVALALVVVSLQALRRGGVP